MQILLFLIVIILAKGIGMLSEFIFLKHNYLVDLLIGEEELNQYFLNIIHVFYINYLLFKIMV